MLDSGARRGWGVCVVVVVVGALGLGGGPSAAQEVRQVQHAREAPSPQLEEALSTLSELLERDDVADALKRMLEEKGKLDPHGYRGNRAPEAFRLDLQPPFPADVRYEAGAVAKAGDATSKIRVQGFKVLTAGPAPLVIPGAAFASDGTFPDSHFFSFSGGYQMGSSSGGDGCMAAPAYLPDGVEVYQMVATLYDNDATNDIYVQLWRVDNSTGVTAIMGEVSTSGAQASIVTPFEASMNYPAVEYPYYSYYVTTCLLGASHRLYAVRVYYY